MSKFGEGESGCDSDDYSIGQAALRFELVNIRTQVNNLDSGELLAIRKQMLF